MALSVEERAFLRQHCGLVLTSRTGIDGEPIRCLDEPGHRGPCFPQLSKPKRSPKAQSVHGITYRLGETYSDDILIRVGDGIAGQPHRYDPTADDDRILGYELPHNGAEATSPRCGEKGLVAHDHSGTAHWRCYQHDCASFACPTCCNKPDEDGKWDPRGYEKRESIAISRRFEEGLKHFDLSDFPVHPRWSHKKTRREREGQNPRLFHIIASPPQEWAKERLWRRSTYRDLWDRLYRTLASRGVVGGVAVFHPMRVPSRWNKRKGCSSGPHWHIIGTTLWGDAFDGKVCGILNTGGPLRPGPLHDRLMDLGMAKPKTRHIAGDGWVVKVKHSESTRSIFSTSAYILSHAGRPLVPSTPDPEEVAWEAPPPVWGPAPTLPASDAEGGAYPALPRSTEGTSGRVERTTRPLGRVPRWFGLFSYNKLKVPEPENEGIQCQICGDHVPAADWHRISWLGEGGFDPPPGLSGVVAWDRVRVIEAEAPQGALAA